MTHMESNYFRSCVVQLDPPNDYELEVLGRDLFIIQIDSRFQ